MRVVLVLLALVAAVLAAPSPKKPFSTMEFDRYWSLEEIYDWMDELERDYPEITEVEIMGRTAEGRDIRGLRVTSEEHLGRETLPIIFLTASKSARDWISTMAVLNVIHELVEHHDEFLNIVDNIEWFIIPVANPDGYEFSRTEGNRAWIKNRSPIEGSDCIGVNIDRNFDFNFGLLTSSSGEPCSSNFRGPAADSEEETKTIQFATDITRRLQRAFITVKAGSTSAHSFVSYPFSSNNELFLPNFNERISVANLATDAIWQQTGTRFRVTSEANVNGFISGTSADYAAGRDQIPLVYTFFAPSGGVNGWDVPEDNIAGIVDAIFPGIEAIATYVSGLPLPDPIN